MAAAVTNFKGTTKIQDRYQTPNPVEDSGTASRSRLRNQGRITGGLKLTPKKAGTAKNLLRAQALATTPWVVMWTAPLYVVQLIGFVFWVVGFGVGAGGEGTWTGWAYDTVAATFGWSTTSDVGGVFVGFGMALSLVAVILGLLIAFILYSIRGVSCSKGNYHIIIIPVLLAFSVVPLSFLPLVWIWCAYVVVSQGNDS